MAVILQRFAPASGIDGNRAQQIAQLLRTRQIEAAVGPALGVNVPKYSREEFRAMLEYWRRFLELRR